MSALNNKLITKHKDLDISSGTEDMEIDLTEEELIELGVVNLKKECPTSASLWYSLIQDGENSYEALGKAYINKTIIEILSEFIESQKEENDEEI